MGFIALQTTSFPGPFPFVGGGAGKGPGIGRSDQHFDWLIDLNNLCNEVPLQTLFDFFSGSRSKQLIAYSYYVEHFLQPTKSVIDQICSVKMAGYWPYSFFRVFMDFNFVSVHKNATNKKGRAKYPAILNEQTWSIMHMYSNGEASIFKVVITMRSYSF